MTVKPTKQDLKARHMIICERILGLAITVAVMEAKRVGVDNATIDHALAQHLSEDGVAAAHDAAIFKMRCVIAAENAA